MERRTNPVPRLAEEINDYDGDILGGIMANHDLVANPTGAPEPSETPVVVLQSGENSLEEIGADNFRGLSGEVTIGDLGLDNFRAKPEA